VSLNSKAIVAAPLTAASRARMSDRKAGRSVFFPVRYADDFVTVPASTCRPGTLSLRNWSRIATLDTMRDDIDENSHCA
jgi:hypothetical protein